MPSTRTSYLNCTANARHECINPLMGDRWSFCDSPAVTCDYQTIVRTTLFPCCLSSARTWCIWEWKKNKCDFWTREMDINSASPFLSVAHTQHRRKIERVSVSFQNCWVMVSVSVSWHCGGFIALWVCGKTAAGARHAAATAHLGLDASILWCCVHPTGARVYFCSGLKRAAPVKIFSLALEWTVAKGRRRWFGNACLGNYFQNLNARGGKELKGTASGFQKCISRKLFSKQGKSSVACGQWELCACKVMQIVQLFMFFLRLISYL